MARKSICLGRNVAEDRHLVHHTRPSDEPLESRHQTGFTAWPGKLAVKSSPDITHLHSVDFSVNVYIESVMATLEFLRSGRIQTHDIYYM